MTDLLKKYKAKRNFAITPEPDASGPNSVGTLSFVIQKHWASQLHYDFRLELNGSMKSWAVPKGPSLDPHDKRMAVHVEDHPISYNKFEGQIPAKQYGAGKVIIWDKGSWEPIGDATKDYKAGHLKFNLHGHKLSGRWALIRMKSRGEKLEAWLLIKEKDDFARPADAFSVIDELPDSVAKLKDNPAVQPKAFGKSKPAKRSTAVSNKAKNTYPEGALKAALPDKLAPQLATLVDAAPPDAEGWQYEIKFDGYRLLTRIDGNGKSIKLFTRNGNDWTAQLPTLAASLAKMKLPQGWYDGEIVALDSKGMPDFQTLQQAFDGADTHDIVYYLFDLPYSGGYDLRKVPLQERRALLGSLLEQAPSDIRFSDTFDIDAADILASACKMGLEGMIGKRQDSVYETRRASSWIKLKCSQRQEFLICGYTDPQGSRTAIGSLLLGIHDEHGKLRYAGNVGTGFDDRSLAELFKKIKPLHTEASPFDGPTGRYRKPHWVKPALLAEVSFAQWTSDGHIRHSVFHGLRTDKKPRAITREKPVAASAVAALKSTSKSAAKAASKPKSVAPATAASTPPQSLLAGLKITHPERVIDTSTGATKIDLIRYYALVAPLMMAHLKGRPVSLVRAPDGIAGQPFFQKHFERANMPGVRALSNAIDPDHPPYLEVAEPAGLLSAAQMNVIEFHTWNGVKTAPAKPDRFSFDLDPGEKSEWHAMQEAAVLVRSFLQELELESLIKTSGGKGLHVVVPIRKQYDWDTIKDFSKVIVEHLAATLPERFSAKSGPRNRIGKIFIDYLRNGFGATTACAWSARARPGLGVSVPIGWDEVEKLRSSAQWHIANIHERLDHGNTPWEGVPFLSQSVTQGMQILGFKPAPPSER